MSVKTDETIITDELNGIAVDAVRDIRRNKIIIPLVLGALCILAFIVIFTYIRPLAKDIIAVGRSTGEISGFVAGQAVGSVEGATTGINAGYNDAIEDALTAEDTIAVIANTIESNVNKLGRLEVLIANVDLDTYHEVGKIYGALYLVRGSAIFTIDLNNAVITYKNNVISVTLPVPEVDVKLDPTETKVLAEWQRKYFKGKDSEGYQAFLNTFYEANKKSDEVISNYVTLFDLAKTSARKQIEEIVRAAKGNNKDIIVTVSFRSN